MSIKTIKLLISIVLLAILVQTFSYAQVFPYVENSRVYLISNNEIQLSKTIESLKKLLFKLEGITVEKEVEIQKSEAVLKVDITELLSERMRHLLIIRNLSYKGPNCLNAVLYFYKLVPDIFYTQTEKFRSYLGLFGSFSEIENPADIQPGDIGVFINRENLKPYHAFIYLHDDLIIEKEGRKPEHPYQIGSLKVVIDYYQDCDLSYYKRDSTVETEAICKAWAF